MAIRFLCPACGKKMSAPEDRAGTTGKCSCGATIKIPKPSEPLEGIPLSAGPADPAVQPCALCGAPVWEDSKLCAKCRSQSGTAPASPQGSKRALAGATVVSGPGTKACPECSSVIDQAAKRCPVCRANLRGALERNIGCHCLGVVLLIVGILFFAHPLGWLCILIAVVCFAVGILSNK